MRGLTGLSGLSLLFYCGAAFGQAAAPAPQQPVSGVNVEAEPAASTATASSEGTAAASEQSTETNDAPASPADIETSKPETSKLETSKLETSKPETQGPRDRGRGFYLRVAGGIAYDWGHTNPTAIELPVKYEGWSTNVQAAVGYMIFPGFVIHGDYSGLYSFDVNVDQEDNSSALSSDGTVLRVRSLGAGVTYHIPPMDFFLSASVGVASGTATQFQYEQDASGYETVVTDDARTEPGLAVNLSVGKLFPVSRKWSIGAGAHYSYASFSPSKDADPDVLALESVQSVWLAFEAAFQP